jgi:hypothetical protein
MAASSPDGESFVWNTTPNDPLPTILHCVYCISLVSPVSPSWTFSRTTSVIQVSQCLAESVKQTIGRGAKAIVAHAGSLGRSYLPYAGSRRHRQAYFAPCLTPMYSSESTLAE